MASNKNRRFKYIFNLYLFFTDDNYYYDVIDFCSKIDAKIRKKARRFKINNFLFKEQIEDNEI